MGSRVVGRGVGWLVGAEVLVLKGEVALTLMVDNDDGAGLCDGATVAISAPDEEGAGLGDGAKVVVSSGSL